jgi:hypothetical protein
MADEVLKRWDEVAQQWKVVASVNRVEVGGGGGGVMCSTEVGFNLFEYLLAPFPHMLTNIDASDI